MNIYQRIVLALGAIALIIALVTTPRVYHHQGGVYRVSPGDSFYDSAVIDKNAVAARLFTVAVSTGFIWFALKGIDKKQKT